MVIAEAEFETEQASRYLVELCRQLDQKAQAKPDLDVRVTWTETDGAVDFGWGRCTMRANESALAFRAEAADDDGVRQVRELVGRHLEKHGDDDPLTLAWRQDGVSAADAASDRRDTMRRFHRRMRH